MLLTYGKLGECKAFWGSPDKAMKCMTMLGDVGNVLARYLLRSALRGCR